MLRAGICKSCPKREPKIGVALTGARELAMLILDRAKESRLRDTELGQCGVCHCLLDVKVWVDGDLNADNHEFPSWCWCNIKSS